MGFDHGAFLVDEHLVRIGDDPGRDAEGLLDKGNALADSSRPRVIVESEPRSVQLPGVPHRCVDNGIAALSERCLAALGDQLPGLLLPQRRANAADAIDVQAKPARRVGGLQASRASK